MATFGTTTYGMGSTTLAADAKYGSKYTLSVPGFVSKLTAFLAGAGGTGSQVAKGVIYADSSGSPGALLGTTGEVTVAGNAGAAWVDLTFSSPISLSDGDYWLCLIAGGTSGKIKLYNNGTTGGSSGYASDTYSDGPSDPCGSISTGSTKHSIYATYSTDITGSGAIQIGSPKTLGEGEGSADITGSGATQAASAAVAGEGTVQNLVGFATWPWRWLGAVKATIGSGAVQIGPVQLAGAGDVLNPVTGEGATQVGAVALAGQGEVIIPITGSGAVQIGPASLAGTGSHGHSGSGATQAGSPRVSGSGNVIEPVTGSGAIAIGPPSVAGTGASVDPVTGSGAIQIGSPTVLGAGVSLFYYSSVEFIRPPHVTTFAIPFRTALFSKSDMGATFATPERTRTFYVEGE